MEGKMEQMESTDRLAVEEKACEAEAAVGLALRRALERERQGPGSREARLRGAESLR